MTTLTRLACSSLLALCCLIVACTDDAGGTTDLVYVSPDYTQVLAFDGEASRVVFTAPEILGQPQWRPGTDEIAVIARVDANGQIDVLTCDLECSNGPLRLTDGFEAEQAFAFSPDGASLAVWRSGGIAVLCLPNCGVTYVGNDAQTDRQAQAGSWSPDGTQIAYASRSIANTSTIRVIDVDGNGEPLDVTPMLTSAAAPGWTSLHGLVAILTVDGTSGLYKIREGAAPELLQAGVVQYAASDTALYMALSDGTISLTRDGGVSSLGAGEFVATDPIDDVAVDDDGTIRDRTGEAVGAGHWPAWRQ